MQAIILAGGFGTRLQSVVKDVPKPLADISGKPFLAYLLQNLQNQGIKKIVLSVGYLQEKIIQYFGDSYLGMDVSYAKEDKPLGTGGAIANSLQFIDKSKPCLVMNGDTFLQVDYQKLLRSHKNNLTMVLRQMDDCSRYGKVVFDQNLFITAFEEKSAIKTAGFINGGVYVLDPKLFENFLLPKNFSFENDFLAKNLDEIKPQAFTVNDYFIDIGIPDDYKKAQNELPQLIKSKALFLDRDGVINIDYGHVFQKENFHFVEEIFAICKKAQELGFLLIIVTNQAGIAKGFYSEDQFLDLTKWMENEFEKRGIKIAKTFYCPYHIEAVNEKYRQDSFNRKPNPGMILEGIAKFNIDPQKSLMAGDKESDIAAAKAANIGKSFLITQKDDYTKLLNSLN
jgi:D,D-heptose 1,7-bisphosphate phosphatase